MILRKGVFTALCSTNNGVAPEWIQLLPRGHVHCLDGRDFFVNDPEKIIKEFEAQRKHGVDIPVDYEHASVLRAPKGEKVDAAGWIDQLDLREDGIYGHVKWNQSGKESIESKAIKYISPAFVIDSFKNVLKLLSAALTIQPAIPTLTALASQFNQGGKSMEKILALLGLGEGASEEEVIAAIEALIAEGKAKEETAAASKISIADYVPRSDFNALAKRLESIETTSLKREIEAEIDGAISAGKITPASREGYLALCSGRDQLAKMRSIFAASSAVLKLGEGNAPAPIVATASLTDEEQKIITVMGISKEDFLATKASK